MTIKDLRPYIEDMKDDEVMCIFSKNKNILLDTIGYYPDLDKIYEHNGSIYGYEVTGETTDTLKTIDIEDVTLKKMNGRKWLELLKRHSIIGFIKSFNSYDEIKEFYNNAVNDQGKYVVFGHSEFEQEFTVSGILLGLCIDAKFVYYAYLKDDGEIDTIGCDNKYYVIEREYNVTNEEIGSKLYEKFNNDSIFQMVYLGKYENYYYPSKKCYTNVITVEGNTNDLLEVSDDDEMKQTRLFYFLPDDLTQNMEILDLTITSTNPYCEFPMFDKLLNKRIRIKVDIID